MKFVERVARIGKIRNAYKVLLEKPEGTESFESRRHDERIILKMIIIETL